MSGSRPNPAERLLAEQHLGDRLSALVDGELGHETRERVLAHLATCARCKSEVDAQRRLKNVFAEAAPPPPSESFLARLQGLPGGGDPDGGGSPLGGGGFDGLSGRPGTTGVFGVKRGDRFEFGYVPSPAHAPALPAADRGFRTHPVGRHDTDRSASSRMRFAFVAAGAVSLAAIALGGVTSSAPTDAEARGGSGSGSNVTPARTPGTGAATAPENQRRRTPGPPPARTGTGPALARHPGGLDRGVGPAAARDAGPARRPGDAHPDGTRGGRRGRHVPVDTPAQRDPAPHPDRMVQGRRDHRAPGPARRTRLRRHAVTLRLPERRPLTGLCAAAHEPD